MPALVSIPGLRVQENRWSCGPCALRHALLLHGKRVAWRTIAELAGIDRDFSGDTTPGLIEVARQFGFQVGHESTERSTMAKLLLQNFADCRIPVLVCVDREEDDPAHWIVVVSSNNRHVVVLDSVRPGPVVRRMTWRKFLGRAAWYHPDDPRWHFYPVRDARVKKDGRIGSVRP